MYKAIEVNAIYEEKADHVERGIVIFIVMKAARMLSGALSSIWFGVPFH